MIALANFYALSLFKLTKIVTFDPRSRNKDDKKRATLLKVTLLINLLLLIKLAVGEGVEPSRGS